MPIKSIFRAVEHAKTQIENLSVEALDTELDAARDLLLVDIRELQERVDLGTIPGAIHVPRGMLEFWVDPESPYHNEIFAEDRKFVFFCAGGWRSALAAKTAADMGLKPVAHMGGGFSAWKEAGGPVDVAEKPKG